MARILIALVMVTGCKLTSDGSNLSSEIKTYFAKELSLNVQVKCPNVPLNERVTCRVKTKEGESFDVEAWHAGVQLRWESVDGVGFAAQVEKQLPEQMKEKGIALGQTSCSPAVFRDNAICTAYAYGKQVTFNIKLDGKSWSAEIPAELKK